jgi:hypothetical protein
MLFFLLFSSPCPIFCSPFPFFFVRINDTKKKKFCHPNHRGVDEDLRIPVIVMMCPHPPSTELEHLIEVMVGRDRSDGQRITVIALQGLPSRVRDLHRVGGE